MLVCPRGKQRKWVDTFRITACPEFDRDDERRSDNRMLTETESEHFLKNINTILRMWADG
jgi:diphthamide synthase subunit DPH2